MKRTLLLLNWFLLYSVLNYGQASSKPKTDTFEAYQQGNKFKGILFGSNVSAIQVKMNLQYLDDFMTTRYSINNYEYLVFNGFRFDKGEAYFTRDGELYHVVLHIDNEPEGLSRYQQLRKKFIELFGGNDSERTDVPTRLVAWDGRNINLLLNFEPDEDNKNCQKGRVSLSVSSSSSILRKKVDDEMFNRNRVPNIK